MSNDVKVNIITVAIANIVSCIMSRVTDHTYIYIQQNAFLVASYIANYVGERYMKV